MHITNTFPNPGNPVTPAPGHISTGSSLPAPAGVVALGAGTPFRFNRLYAGRFNCMLTMPDGTWRRHSARGDISAPCLGMLTGHGMRERRA